MILLFLISQLGLFWDMKLALKTGLKKMESSFNVASVLRYEAEATSKSHTSFLLHTSGVDIADYRANTCRRCACMLRLCVKKNRRMTMFGVSIRNSRVIDLSSGLVNNRFVQHCRVDRRQPTYRMLAAFTVIILGAK